MACLILSCLQELPSDIPGYPRLKKPPDTALRPQKNDEQDQPFTLVW